MVSFLDLRRWSINSDWPTAFVSSGHCMTRASGKPIVMRTSSFCHRRTRISAIRPPESAACGTPVIVTDRCGIASFVGQAGLVISHDLEQLELALGQTLGDPNLRERYQEGCAEMSSAAFVGGSHRRE